MSELIESVLKVSGNTTVGRVVLSQLINEISTDEFGDLTKNFNQMAA